MVKETHRYVLIKEYPNRQIGDVAVYDKDVCDIAYLWEKDGAQVPQDFQPDVCDWFQHEDDYKLNVTTLKVNDSSITKNKLRITFTTKQGDALTVGSFVKLSDGRGEAFRITGISTKGIMLEYEAKEVGYWARSLTRVDGFNPFSLIGSELVTVTDEKEVSEISKRSCWC